MAKIKMWMPVSEIDLPVGLAASLRVAQRNGMSYQVCEAKVVEMPATYSAEILRLRELVRALETQLALTIRRREPHG